MDSANFSFFGKQVVIYSDGKISPFADDLIKSSLFQEVMHRFLDQLQKKESSLLSIFSNGVNEKEIIELFWLLTRYQKKHILTEWKQYLPYFKDEYVLLQFVEELYNFWRSYERFFVCYSDEMLTHPQYEKPYTTFNDTVENLNNLVRRVYRDICENISGDHPRVYRQIPAGAQVGLIVAKEPLPLPSPYDKLSEIHYIKQVLIEPPLIIDPPKNTRTGEFKRITKNPMDFLPKLNESEWICYPAQVGDLIMTVYFNNKFIGLGTALSNLFDLATEEQLKKKPDAVFVFGISNEIASSIDENKTVFFEDTKNNLFVGTIPEADEFGYFGYLKKMMLTLHNAIMMKRGRLPVHGAMVKIDMKNNKSANIVIMGDTGAGKSESLEAFRKLGEEYIREMIVIFDDMGSLGIEEGKIKAYGTETGAFVRLDDLNPGYAFGNIDRSIIMSPQKKNARVVLPITTMKEVLRGHKVDYFLYANNFETVDENHLVFEKFNSSNDALAVFKRGRSMSKGTTSSTGITETYFVNVFGPTQYKEVHDPLAEKYFKALFDSKVVVGQLRTQLAVSGKETFGPEMAAKALLEEIKKS